MWWPKPTTRRAPAPSPPAELAISPNGTESCRRRRPHRRAGGQPTPLSPARLKPDSAASMQNVDAADAQAPPRASRHRLPGERASVTHKFAIAGHEGYITVGLYPNGYPGEIFIRMAKEGSTVSGLMDSFATAISISLQHGVPLKVLCEKFAHTRFEPSGWTGNPEIGFAKSIMDYIFRWIQMRFLSGDAARPLRRPRPRGQRAGGEALSPLRETRSTWPPPVRTLPTSHLGRHTRPRHTLRWTPSPAGGRCQPAGHPAARGPYPQGHLRRRHLRQRRGQPVCRPHPAPPWHRARPLRPRGRCSPDKRLHGRPWRIRGSRHPGAGTVYHASDAMKSMYDMGDAPSCATCGAIMTRSGSCYRCMSCGSTSGCS